MGYCTSEDDVEKSITKDYATKTPHSSTQISLDVYIPKEMDCNLLEQMNTISSDIQDSGNQQRPHTIRDILSNEIKKLTRSCASNKEPYLWDCLELIYKMMMGNVLMENEWNLIEKGICRCNESCDFMKQMKACPQDKNDKNAILDLYVSLWVKTNAEIILDSFDDSKLLHLWYEKNEGTTDTKKIRLSCFKKVDHRKEEKNGDVKSYQNCPCI